VAAIPIDLAADPNGRRMRMRAFLAFILGIVVTVGAAFIHDTMVAGASPYVNWDAVHSTAGSVVATVRNQFNKK
jgi:hypothetical protein